MSVKSKENTKKLVKKEISIDQRLVAIFISHYMSWGVNCHPAAIIILNYSGIWKYIWLSPEPVQIDFYDAANILLNSHAFLIPQIRSSSFDMYIKYCSTHHTNYDMGYEWFMSLDSVSRIRLFADYSLEQVSEYLHIAQKSKNSFMKALKGKDATSCAIAYIDWHATYKQIRTENSKIKKLG